MEVTFLSHLKKLYSKLRFHHQKIINYVFLPDFSETPAKIQHSQKAKTVFLEVEPEFWIVLNVALPHRIKTKADGVKDINYYSDKLHDNVLEAILQRTYDMFKIFTGNFTNFLRFSYYFFINLVL